MCTCENCPYFWADTDDGAMVCHWESHCPGDVAPCDEEDMPVYHEEHHFYVRDREGGKPWKFVEVPETSAEAMEVEEWDLDTDGEGRVDYYEADPITPADVHDYGCI